MPLIALISPFSNSRVGGRARVYLDASTAASHQVAVGLTAEAAELAENGEEDTGSCRTVL